MKGRKFQYVLCICFFAGVIFQNLIAQKHAIEMPIFQEQNLLLIIQSNVILEDFVWYVVKSRLVLLVILLFPLLVKNKRRMVSVYLGIFSFLAGGLCVSSVLELGISGILIFFASLIPQYLLYGFAWSILFLHCYYYPSVKMNATKMIVFVVFFLVGVILEIYVNPALLKVMIGIL